MKYFHRILSHPLFLALLALVTLCYFGAGIYAYHAEKTSQAAFQERLDKVRAGESVRIAGYQWMKISEVKAEAGNVR